MLLLGELNHRVKNTLATVHSLALQTARTAGDESEALRRFLADFQARLMALSRGHDLLTARTWRGATLNDAAQAALSLAALAGGGQRRAGGGAAAAQRPAGLAGAEAGAGPGAGHARVGHQRCQAWRVESSGRLDPRGLA
ncbi:HWE histidine kinase domain-containing protein [Pseudoroseomonas wenyumeiae]